MFASVASFLAAHFVNCSTKRGRSLHSKIVKLKTSLPSSLENFFLIIVCETLRLFNSIHSAAVHSERKFRLCIQKLSMEKRADL